MATQLAGGYFLDQLASYVSGPRCSPVRGLSVRELLELVEQAKAQQ